MSGNREWLDDLGRGEFAEALEAEHITPDALPQLTEANLKELGLPRALARKCSSRAPRLPHS
jgi:hypothetical protein